MARAIGLSILVFIVGLTVGVVWAYFFPPPPLEQPMAAVGQKPTPEPPSEPPSWTFWRGDAGNRGVAPGALPKRLDLLWEYKTQRGVKSSAVIADGKAYVGSGEGKLHAIHLNSGEAAWVHDAEDPIEAPPTAHGDAIYFGTTGGVACKLNANDGKLVWKHDVNDQITGAIVPVTQDDRKLALIPSHDGYLHAVDADTGKPLWQYDIGQPIFGAPAVENGRAVFGGCDGNLHVVDLKTGEAVKTVEAGAYIACSAALDRGKIFAGTYGSEFVAADLEKGTVLWKFTDTKGEFHASPAVTDQSVIVGNRDKFLRSLDRATGKMNWAFAARAKIDSSPVVVGDDVVVGSHDGRLYVINLQDGKQRWSYEVGGRLSASPAVAGGVIVIGSEGGSVFAFGAPKKGNPTK